jgi:hypothetical protein
MKMEQSGLQILKDDRGSVALGWVASQVLYAQIVGNLSATLGAAYASQIQILLGQVSGARYFFADASGLKSYDLLARSAFVRVVHANRRAFASVVVLTWSGGISRAAEAFAATLGNIVELITDKHEFDLRLRSAAPLAEHYLNPKTWSPLVSPSKPAG